MAEVLKVKLCGGVAVEADGRRLPDTLLAGHQGRLVLAYLVCERHRSVPREELAELVWGEQPPASWQASLSAVVSKLRRLFGEAGLDGVTTLASAFGSYRLHLPDDVWVDWEAANAGLESAERAVRAGDAASAVASAAQAEEILRLGFLTDDCAWVDGQRALVRDALVRAVQARAEAHLLASERARAVAAAREALALDPLRESAYRLLMRALAAAGERGEALRVWEQCRTLLVEELGSDPAPETEAVYLEILRDEPSPSSLPSGVVTFLLTDIVGSSGLWERQPSAMAAALERHDALAAEAARSHGGQLLKSKLEGDATVSVFARATSGALAALALLDALTSEPWPDGAAPLVRMALHTGEAFERDGDFFGPALNRAARLRSLAEGGQILVSQAHAELVRDHLPDYAALRSLGHRDLRGLSRGEDVYELTPAIFDDADPRAAVAVQARFVPPPIPAALTTSGPFVGRENELERLATEWEHTLAGTPRVVLLGGEPGVGKTRLASERARQIHDEGGIVVYGRCDEDLGAPYQPFSEALRTLLPCVGGDRLAAMRGVEQLVRLVPELTDLVPDFSPPSGGDPDADRYVLFDALARLLASVSTDVPMLLVLDDLHWANKATLLMLRHLLRFGEGARIQIVGTYRTTDLDPAHPLAATLADLHRDGTASRVVLGGLAQDDVTAYLDAAGYDDEELGRAVASVTAGNPFFMIEVLRHVEESGGSWDPSTLPQGVREAVGRRLARLTPDANEALLAGAVVGGRFSLDLVERVVGRDLIDAVSEACDAGIIVEETGGWFRFNHAIVRRSLLAAVASVKRVRLHQRIAEHLEAATSGAADGLADLAHHYFESAWAGNAAKAVEYCRRAGDQAMERLAFEGAADFYDRAVQALDIDDTPGREGERAELLLARCEALLAAGDVSSATEAVSRLEESAGGSPRLAAWATCFTGQLAVLGHPDQLDTIEGAVAAAADQLAELGDSAGEAKAHTVRASCLARLGRIADCETALDRALTVARVAGDHRRVNAVLAFAPLAALWGPSPVPRAGGRCLDVIRLLRITTGSAAVEATSTRCQAVLEAFRGRATAGRRMLDTARRSLTDLGLRHGLLEVDLFAGIVELVADDAAAAEPYLRHAYAGFRRMGVRADTAQAAALLARASAALGRDSEADELCTESERIAGHDLKASIAWRAVRAQLLAGRGEHAEARRLAEAAVALAERTDALVDHGDACLALATVLDAAGDHHGAQAAAERAAGLYDRKGAAALVERARGLAGTSARDEGVVDREVATNHPASMNETVQRMEAVATLFAQRDWTALRDLLPTHSWLDDRRRVVGQAGKFIDLVRVLRSFADLGSTQIDYAVLATRGERLALTVQTFRGVDEYEDPSLLVGRTTDDQMPELAIYLELEDLDAAYAELDALYLAGEAAPYADVFRTVTAGVDAYNRRDGDPPVAPDLAFVDHRPASVADLDGRTALLSYTNSLLVDVPDLTMRLAAVHALDGRGAVITAVQKGATPDGASIEILVHAVQLVDEGRMTRMEVFPEDALDAALARFRELGSGPPALENAATRAMDQWQAFFVRRDWDALSELFAQDYVHEERRAVVQRTMHGRGEYLENLRAVVDVGATDMSASFIATRGERAGLMRTRWAGRDARPDASSVEILELFEVDSDGRFSRCIDFEPEDLGAAYAELDARYLAGEGAAHADTLAPMFEFLDAYNLRDWQRAGALMADDFSMVDHRLASFDAIEGADAFIRAIQPLIELVPSVRGRASAIHAVGRGAAVIQIETSGTTPEGSEIELAFHVAYATDAGCVTHWEFFPEDQLDAALSRSRELGSRAPELENAATRSHARFATHFARRDWEAADALFDDHTVYDDRRAGLRSTHRGRREVMAMTQGAADIGVADFVTSVLATRGARSSLHRTRMVGRDRRPDAFHTELLQLLEVTPDGLLADWLIFDVGDLEAAYAELDAYYLAGEGAPYADTLVPMFEFLAAYNARDWPRARARLDDRFAVSDHRPAPALYGDIDGPDAFIRALQPLLDLAPVMCVRTLAIHAVESRGAVLQLRTTTTTVEGSDIELAYHIAYAAQGGVLTHVEFYAENQLDAALARFRELGSGSPGLQNAATRAHARFATHFARRDWEALGELWAEDSVYDDDRAGVRSTWRGRGEVVAMAQGVADIGVTEVVTSVLATRGDRSSLLRSRYVGRDRRPEAFHTELLDLIEVDGNDRITDRSTLDFDDLDAAYAELDVRYLAGEGAPRAAVWKAVVENHAALSRHEFAPVTDDFEFVDRRRGGTSIGPQQVTAYMRASFEDTPDAVYRTTAVHELADHGAVISVSVEGTSQAGFQAIWSLLNVITVRVGRIARIEFYADDQLDAALARLDELAHSYVVLENAATRVSDRVRAAVNRAAWEDMELLLTTDFTQEDRRRDRLGQPVVSRRAYLAGARASESVGLTRVDGMTLATRGDRLALYRHVLRGADDRPDTSRWEWLGLSGADEAGLQAFMVWFDPDDLDAAYAELEARYIAREAAPHAAVWAAIVRGFHHLNARQPLAITPDFVSVDHRPASFAPGELVAGIGALWELVPDARYSIAAVHALDRHGAVVGGAIEGTSRDGADVRWSFVNVLTLRADLLARVEVYPDEQLDAALARFEELAGRQLVLENAATRSADRIHSAFNRDRWDEVDAILATDFTQEDRRRNQLGRPVVSRRAFIAGGRAWREPPGLFTHVETTTLALRGDRLALLFSSLRGDDDQPGAPRWEYLSVIGGDDDDRIPFQVWFEPDDLSAAYAELDARYLAGEAAPFIETWATHVEVTAAYNARDREGYRSLLSGDVVEVDHRPASLGYITGMWALVPDIAFRVVTVHALGPHGSVAQFAGRGTSTAGMAAEWSFVQVCLVGSGVVTRVEIFPDDQLDAALARFKELGGTAPTAAPAGTGPQDS